MSRAAPLIVWSLWAISVLGTIVEVAFFLMRQQAGIGAAIADSLYALIALVFPTVGAIIASRRGGNLVGWLLCATGPAGLIQVGLPAYAQWTLAQGSDPAGGVFAAWLVQWTYLPSFALVALILLLFPNGRLPSARWTPALVVVLATAAVGTLGYAFLPELHVQGRTRNPFGIDSEIPQVAATFGDLLFTVAGIPVAAVSVIVRLARARGDERQQLKWLAYAGVLAAVGAIVGSLYYGTQPVMLVAALMFLSIPAAIGVAILRYRLYDIDLLINRTVVYGATSATIAATFYGGVLALQGPLRQLTLGSEFGVAASTLLALALFQPIRRRVQNEVDRRFDRSRYDAARTLDAFADRLRDDVDLDALRSDLIDVVRQTMGSTQTSLWLRDPQR